VVSSALSFLLLLFDGITRLVIYRRADFLWRGRGFPTILNDHVFVGVMYSTPQIWVHGVHFCCSSLNDGNSRVWVLGISRYPHVSILFFTPLRRIRLSVLFHFNLQLSKSWPPLLLFQFPMDVGQESEWIMLLVTMDSHVLVYSPRRHDLPTFTSSVTTRSGFLGRFTGWVPRGMYCPWITTMSSGHDVSDSPLKP